MIWRLIYSSIIVLLLMPAWVRAKKDQWQDLEQARTGNRVEAIDTHLKSYVGRFVRFSETDLTLQVKNQEITIPKDEVYRITLIGKDRKLNAIAGLAIGSAAGAGLAVATFEHEGNYAGAVAGAAVGLGGLGAGIGAILPANRTIYRNESAKETSAESGSALNSHMTATREAYRQF